MEVVFSELKQHEPKMFNKKTQKWENWHNFATNKEHKEFLLGAVVECGKYRLPKEYYDKKPDYK